ncbi:hypothetical protein ILUMI_20222 [Ignelater luminosus]|uniref:HTH CENPB-type domain-containing protein n=1 Tax=Ignelater luminosus TaxID=2038154 RepID=A0A8K0CHT9_IGNLU|nr:hypothetical protein ILUMI_20222 [Ignelater luminosus]
MPKTRPRSTNKAAWSSASLAQAYDLMKEGLSMRQAAKSMNIPFSSLQKRLKKQAFADPRLGRHTVFTTELENVLAERIKLLSNIFYGCTGIQIRKIAYKYANELGLQHKFDSSSKMAGRDWLEGFLRRNKISIRKPEATSINRITAFNKTETLSISVPIAAQMPSSSMSSTTDNQMPSTSTQSKQPVPDASSSQVINTLLPIPKGKPSVTIRKGRAKQHAQILTTTLLKASLIDKENKKIAKKTKEETKRNENNKKSAKTVKGRAMVASNKRLAQQKSVNKAKRRVLQDQNSSTESDISLTKICDDNEDDDADDAGNICMICSEFGRNNEMWYRCTSCGLWVHEDCTGWDSPEGYVCDNC